MHLAAVIVSLHEHHGSALPRELARALELASTALQARPKSSAAEPASAAAEPTTPAASPARPPGSWATASSEAPQESRKRPAEALSDDAALPASASEAALSPGEAELAARAERWREPSCSRSRSRSRGSSPSAPPPSPPSGERAPVPASSPVLFYATALFAPSLPLRAWREPAVSGLQQRGFLGLDLVRDLASAWTCPDEVLDRARSSSWLRGDRVTNTFGLFLWMRRAHMGMDQWRWSDEERSGRALHWVTLGVSFLYGHVPQHEVPTFGDRAVRRRLLRQP